MARDDEPLDAGWDPDGDPAGVYDDEPEWTAADEERYQARRQEEIRRRRRARRQGLSFALVVLLVLGAGVGAAGIVQGWWEWPFDEATERVADGPQCPTPTVVAAPPNQTRVVVLNATEISGLATAVGQQLEVRGFQVVEVGNEDDSVAVPESAQIRHGPETRLQATAVAAQFRSAVLVDDGRTGDTVELSVGLAYRRMVDAEEAAAAITPVPGPSPDGCTPVDQSAPPTPSEEPVTPAPTP